MIPKKLAPATTEVAEFSDKIMRNVKKVSIVVVQGYRRRFVNQASRRSLIRRSAKTPDIAMREPAWEFLAARAQAPFELVHNMHYICLKPYPMPRIVRLASVTIYIHADDHAPPHFHVVGPDANLKVSIETLQVMRGQ
jgi:hypothetical protein